MDDLDDPDDAGHEPGGGGLEEQEVGKIHRRVSWITWG
jgi:hypothetical protein